MGDPVILLHGLWLRGFTLKPLAWRLAAAGFAPETFDYPSVRGGPEPAVARLVARIRAHGGPVALVGHSLGGSIALQALRREPGLPVRRVVCLGSPLAGSAAAAGLSRRPAFARLLGRSRGLLASGIGPWDGAVPVGVVAGAMPVGLGRMFGGFEGPHDGTVAVAETRVPGLAGHCVVRASHSGLLFSSRAAAQVAAFLRDGSFLT